MTLPPKDQGIVADAKADPYRTPNVITVGQIEQQRRLRALAAEVKLSPEKIERANLLVWSIERLYLLQAERSPDTQLH